MSDFIDLRELIILSSTPASTSSVGTTANRVTVTAGAVRQNTPCAEETNDHDYYIMTNDNNDGRWTHNATLILIDLYKKYRNKVGTLKIPNLKKLWQIISEEIEGLLKIKFTPSQVENRWRVLYRNYKKYVDNNNQTGRGRKHFEYAKEMEEIFSKKANICPEVVLSNETVVANTFNTLESETETGPTEAIPVIKDKENIPVSKKPSTLTVKKHKSSSRNTVLELIRQDRKAYYKECLSLKRERLELQKEMQSKLNKKNELIKERNDILKQYLKEQISLPGNI